MKVLQEAQDSPKQNVHVLSAEVRGHRLRCIYFLPPQSSGPWPKHLLWRRFQAETIELSDASGRCFPDMQRHYHRACMEEDLVCGRLVRLG